MKERENLKLHHKDVEYKNNTDLSKVEGKYLTFYSDEQLYGSPIIDVVQIVGLQTITPIPNSPEYVKGIINLRGDIIPVIDMRIRLERADIPYTERTCIIVTNIANRLVGIIVDSVDEVVAISPDMISVPPKISQQENTFLFGIAKLKNKIALLINTDKFIGDEFINLEKTSY